MKITVLIVGLALLCFSDESAAQHLDSNKLLRCPVVDLDRFTSLRIADGPFRIAWNKDEQAPFANLSGSTVTSVLHQVLFRIRTQLGTMPFKTVVLVQVNLPNAIGALVCPSYQQPSEGVAVIFVAPDTFENEMEFGRLVAHELYHIWFHGSHREPTELWIEEGLAYLFEFIVVERVAGGLVLEHLANPCDSLDVKVDDPSYLSGMGQAQLFMVYLQAQTDGQFFKLIHQKAKISTETITAVASQLTPFGWSSFEDIFVDFQIAKRLNRIDHYAKSEALERRYFIFETTFLTTRSCRVQSMDLSSEEHVNLSSFNRSRPQKAVYLERVVVDDSSGPIVVGEVHPAVSAVQRPRYLRVYLNPVDPVLPKD